MRHTTAFLHEIRNNKHDDLPRLVFADYLEETGDPHDRARAEFIRLGVELAKLKDHPDRATREPEIVARIKAICGEIGRAEALFVLSGTKSSDWSNYRPEGSGRLEIATLLPRYFFRGFVREVVMSHDAFLKNAESIFRENPVEKVTLTDREPHRFDSPSGTFGWLLAEGEDSEPFRLNRDLFALLPRTDRSPGLGQWNTREEALAALATAALELGESLVAEAVTACG